MCLFHWSALLFRWLWKPPVQRPRLQPIRTSFEWYFSVRRKIRGKAKTKCLGRVTFSRVFCRMAKQCELYFSLSTDVHIPNNYHCTIGHWLGTLKELGRPFVNWNAVCISFRLRRSTWNRFQSIATKNTPLSELLRKATEEDPVAPVLSDPHFRAIDRRMKIAIDTIKKCIKSHGEAGVLVSEEDF